MTPIAYIFLGLAIAFFLAFVFQRLTAVSLAELNEQQAKYILELTKK